MEVEKRPVPVEELAGFDEAAAHAHHRAELLDVRRPSQRPHEILDSVPFRQPRQLARGEGAGLGVLVRRGEERDDLHRYYRPLTSQP